MVSVLHLKCLLDGLSAHVFPVVLNVFSLISVFSYTVSGLGLSLCK